MHLAATPVLAQVLVDKGCTAIAFETVEKNGRLPLLAPMSDVAGKLAVQIGANLLQRPHGGRGLLLGGLSAAERGSVVVIGAGNVGGAAVELAAGLGANVTVFALSRPSLNRMRAYGHNVTALYSFHHQLVEAVRNADLLIGAVLITGARAPKLVDAEMVSQMREGSVIVDVAVDQGGCIETIRPTDYTDPTYVQSGVVHFGVTNMPAAVPRTSSQALSAALIRYVLALTEEEWQDEPVLRSGINVQNGRIVHPAVAASLQMSG
jgi:alanine dehydrogenase